MDLDLGGKVFIVSGGTSGLGAAVAAGLVGEGARVVGLAADLRGATTPPPAARQSFGRLDGAFVSHGGPDPGPATDLDDARLRRAMESAVVAPIALIREIVRELPSGGAVVALTSSTGVEPMVGMAASNVARAAVHGYVKTIATEVATRGVRVNVLIPGPSPRPACSRLRPRAPPSSGTVGMARRWTATGIRPSWSLRPACCCRAGPRS